MRSSNKNNRAKCRYAVFFITLAVAVSHAQSPSPILFGLKKTAITAGEPVLLDVKVRNAASEPLVVDFGLNAEDGISISAVDPAGKSHQKPEPAIREGLQSFGWMRLDNGQEYSKTLILNEWFDFSQIGHYEIIIELKKAPILGDKTLSITIPPLMLEVAPYDRAKLELACRELTLQIRKRNIDKEYLAAGIAIRALVYIRDPVVVPYWNQVLEYADGVAVSSLRKIATLEAVHVLARALHSHDSETRSQAHFALQSIEHETSDPMVRAQAKLALKPHP